MSNLRDFLAAGKTLVAGSLSRGADAFQTYLNAFEKFASFEEVPDDALRALIANLEIVPAEGHNLQTKGQLLGIVRQIEEDRLNARRHTDDQSLDPLVTRDYDTEESFVERVVKAYPNIPPAFASDLLFRGDQYFAEKLPWLDVRSAHFRTEMWDTARIIAEVKHPYAAGVQIEVDKFKNMRGYRSDYSLAEFMSTEGTWPVPLPVFDNEHGLRDPHEGELARFQALDGMHRLGFLIAMNELAMPLKPSHAIFLIRSAS